MHSYKIILSILAVFFTTFSARSEVTPVMIRLSAGVIGQAGYSVPAGKVLVINHVRISGTGLASPTIRVGMDILNTPVFADVSMQIADGPINSGRLYSISPPIRVKGGSGRLTIPPEMTSGTQIFLGLLIDATDLYAADIPLELEDPRLTNGRLVADAKVASPRPRVLKIESSDNLTSFAADDTSRVTGAANPNQSVISVEANEDQKYIRAQAIARSGER